MVKVKQFKTVLFYLMIFSVLFYFPLDTTMAKTAVSSSAGNSTYMQYQFDSSGSTGSTRRKRIDGNVAYCVQLTSLTFEVGKTYTKANAYTYYSNKSNPQAFIKKIAVYKYYIYNNLHYEYYSDKNALYNLTAKAKEAITQIMVWRQTGKSNAWLKGTTGANKNNFTSDQLNNLRKVQVDILNGAAKFYKKHKNDFEVKSDDVAIWKNSSHQDLLVVEATPKKKATCIVKNGKCYGKVTNGGIVTSNNEIDCTATKADNVKLERRCGMTATCIANSDGNCYIKSTYIDKNGTTHTETTTPTLSTCTKYDGTTNSKKKYKIQGSSIALTTTCPHAECFTKIKKDDKGNPYKVCKFTGAYKNSEGVIKKINTKYTEANCNKVNTYGSIVIHNSKKCNPVPPEAECLPGPASGDSDDDESDVADDTADDDPNVCHIHFSGGEIEDQTVNCSDYKNATVYTKDNVNYTLNNVCPVTELKADCIESNPGNIYGKCTIRVKDVAKNPEVIVDTEVVDCNQYHCPAGSSNCAKYSYTDDNDIDYDFDVSCPYKIKYNYDVDVACENCDGNNTKGSYQIQDMHDWTAIKHVPVRNDAPQLASHYVINSNYLCREEFNVVLPNSNNVKKLTASKGTYITVNLDGTDIIDDWPNFKTIKVTRTRQCVAKNGGSNFGSLSSLGTATSTTNVVAALGSVNLNYIEDVYSHKFIGTEALKPDLSRTQLLSRTITNVSGVGYVAVDKMYAYYVLDDNVYRYTSLGNGKSVVTRPTDISGYRDVGKPNLPLSFVNTSGATIQLSYSLPSSSKLKALLADGKVTSLSDGSDASEPNFYQSNRFSDSGFSKSACYNLFSGNNTKYQACVNARKVVVSGDDANNPAQECYVNFSGENADGEVFANATNPNDDKAYTCKINPGDGTECKTEEDARRLGFAWNSTTRKCELKCRKETSGGTTVCYDENNNQIDCSTEWQKQCTCKIVGTSSGQQTYLGKNGEVLYDYKQYARDCACPIEEQTECPEETWITIDGVKDPCARCPSGACPMPGGVCPGSGKRDIIYRPIDLADPFPGQSGNTRETGTNWCTRDINGAVLSCSGKSSSSEVRNGNNSIIYNEIINNRTTANYSVYQKDPLYTIKLDSKAIRKIQSINDSHDYDDWNYIKYDSVNKIYYSRFLNENFNGQQVTGTCMQGNASKKTCAER